MKACYEVEERIRRHNENCKADCVNLVEKNIKKKAWTLGEKPVYFPVFPLLEFKGKSLYSNVCY